MVRTGKILVRNGKFGYEMVMVQNEHGMKRLDTISKGGRGGGVECVTFLPFENI